MCNKKKDDRMMSCVCVLPPAGTAAPVPAPPGPPPAPSTVPPVPV